MLEKVEIYPYQRISDQEESKRRSRRMSIRASARKLRIPTLPVLDVKMLAGLLSMEYMLLAVSSLLMARAFVLGELLPFAFAWVAAFGRGDRARTLLVAIFTVAGFASALQGVSFWTNLGALIGLAVILLLVTVPGEKSWWGYPLIMTTGLLVVKTLLNLFYQFSFYQEMVIVFEAIIAGVLTFVFLVARDVLVQRKSPVQFAFEDVAAFLVVGTGLIMGLNGIEVGGLSLSGILCRLAVLVAAFLWGSGGGTMVGVISGIIPSVTSSVFAQSLGMFAVSGLLAGLFRNFGRLGVIIGFTLGSLALSFFINDTQATLMGIWETGAAALLFMLIPASLKEQLPIQSLGPIRSLKPNELENIDLNIRDSARNRIEHLANVFEELSSTFTGEAKVPNRVNRDGYLNYLYDEISSGFCRSCSRYANCWERDCYATSQEILDIFTLVESAGEASYEQCPVEFRRRCIYGREMVNTINYLFDQLRINEYWAEQLQESRDLVSRQLQGISRVVKKLAAEIDLRTAVDLDLRQRLLREARSRQAKIRDITPIRSNSGQLYLHVVMDACSSRQQCQLEISPLLSGLSGEKMEVCEKQCPRLPGKGQCSFTLTRAFAYRVLTGAVQVGKEQVCGDSFTVATLKEGKELVALSDGMGVGEKARHESQAAVRLLENLLSTGFDRDLALKTINSVLILRSSAESFTTLDMLMIDLYTGELDVIKVGAAPSFIKRGRKVGALTSNSLPIGILEEVDVFSEKLALCPHDLLVMVSDGVLEVGGESHEGWLREFLTDVDEKDPQVLAELIINKALALCKGKPADDMTVLCMYVDLN